LQVLTDGSNIFQNRFGRIDTKILRQSRSIRKLLMCRSDWFTVAFERAFRSTGTVVCRLIGGPVSFFARRIESA